MNWWVFLGGLVVGVLIGIKIIRELYIDLDKDKVKEHYARSLIIVLRNNKGNTLFASRTCRNGASYSHYSHNALMAEKEVNGWLKENFSLLITNDIAVYDIFHNEVRYMEKTDTWYKLTDAKIVGRPKYFD